MNSSQRVSADLGDPILFRTTNDEVYRAALQEGSLWLRSADYYRQLEDQVRRDHMEGVSGGRTTIPLRLGFQNENNMLDIQGSGTIGQVIVPHYVLSLHGTSISPAQLQSFGGHTFGIRSLFKLTMEVFHQASQIIDCHRYRFGAVSYRYTALAQARAVTGSGAIQLSEKPPLYLNPADTDVLRKLPVMPFVEQDEWRVVIFTNGYVDGDVNAPLKIKVRPSHFYPYSSAAD